MKFSNILWLSMAVAAPAYGQAGMFGRWGSDNKKEVAAATPTKITNKTIHDKIHEERRYVLFNSRRLSGECLSVCVPDSRTDDDVDTDTRSPTEPPTGAPTDRPTDRPTDAPTDKPTDRPTDAPTDRPTDKPTDRPTDAPTDRPTGHPTDSPTKSPTKTPTAFPTDLPDAAPPVPDGLDCEDLVNLGNGLGAATPPYGGCYPHITGNLPNNLPKDNSVNVFAGGDFIGVGAAEVEGNVVVLGNLIVQSGGPGNFGSVGAGSQIYPPNDSECIRVGGNIGAYRDIQVQNQREYMKCDIIYKGTSTNIDHWKTNGRKYKNEHLDLSYYEKMKYVLEKKSKYWSTLESTGTISTADGARTVFECSNENIQVFNFTPDKHNLLERKGTFHFSSQCRDKTILINVLKSGDIGIYGAPMYDFDEKLGHGAGGFSTCLTQNILWNIPHADNVEVGLTGTSEFHGSVLATGNFNLATTGLSGRAMILGNIQHGPCGGSEFHSYQFNPPVALPDPEDICVIPDNLSLRAAYGSVAAYPTLAPTAPPTLDPTKCLAKPNNQGITDTHCEECAQGKTTWPCNLDICVGKCEKELDPTKCMAKPNNNGVTDTHCRKCPEGKADWPCDLDICVGKCEKQLDPTKCMAKPNKNGVEDTHCQKCPEGKTDWPCNLDICVGKCEKQLDPTKCMAKPNNNNISDHDCQQCKRGIKHWPCNVGVCVGNC